MNSHGWKTGAEVQPEILFYKHTRKKQIFFGQNQNCSFHTTCHCVSTFWYTSQFISTSAVHHNVNRQLNDRNILCVRRNIRCVGFVSRNFNEFLTTSRELYCVRDCKYCHTMSYWEGTVTKEVLL